MQISQTVALRDSRRRQILFTATLAVVVSAWLSVSLGSYDWQWSAIWKYLTQPDSASRDIAMQWYVLWDLRLPRTLMALCVGALLGMAGCAMQGLVRNPLADPGLIGISGGAAAAAATSMAILPLYWPQVTPFATVIAAFCGALLTVAMVLQMAKRPHGVAVSTLILAGVAINALTGTVIGAISYLADDDALRQISYWTMGSLAGANWLQVGILSSCLIASASIFWHCRSALNLFALGEQEAAYQGLDTRRYKNMLLWAVAFAVALATALCGIIGFIGLVIPHICRNLVGVDQRYLMPASGILGSALLILSDCVSRSLFSPLEIPIGIITSAVGAPFFLYLLYQQRGASYA
jgi:iron complex transport system permease protein